MAAMLSLEVVSLVLSRIPNNKTRNIKTLTTNILLKYLKVLSIYFQDECFLLLYLFFMVIRSKTRVTVLRYVM